MPKIIEDLRERLLQEAQKQITTSGYSAMTIRSVARSCQVAVGTVYNYFPSKDELIASVMLGRWNECMQSIASAAETAIRSRTVLQTKYNQLSGYIDEYRICHHTRNISAKLAGHHSTRRSCRADEA